ncbi:MAG: hypothetical protein KGJ62_05615 [Armatimonadetes bacterium]|nr:hypothetical protein [Armatimonadota bacterium]
MSPGATTIRPKEGLMFVRFFMVLGSMAPLFVFLAIRGVPAIDGKPLIADPLYVSLCLILVVLPAGVLALRVYIAGKSQDFKELVVGTATDHRDHLIAYLFAMVMPLYQNNYASVRDVMAELAALVFVIFLFTHMNLHYMNLVFALADYRVYTIETEGTSNAASGRNTLVLLTKRRSLRTRQRITARRLSDTVFIEYEK